MLAWFLTIIGFLIVSVSWHINVVGVGLFLAGAGFTSTLNTTFFFLSEVV